MNAGSETVGDPRESPQRRWGLLLASTALLIASLLPLGAVVQGGDWWVAAVIAILAVLVPAGVARSLGAPSWVGTFVGAGVWLGSLVLFFAPQTALLGVVPTPDTVTAFQRLTVDAGQSLYVQSVPVEPVEPLLFLLSVGLGAVAVLADVVGVSLRSPALLGVLSVGLLVPPSLFTGEVDLVAYGIAAIAYLWVLRAARPVRDASPTLPALAVGAAAVAVTLVAGTLAPAFSSGSLVQPAGESAFGSGVSELADLGRDLQRPGNTPHFSYQTTSDTRQYLRMLTLDRFEGARWTSSGDHTTAAQDDGERLQVPGLSDAVASEEVTVDVQITGLVGDLLPVPFPSVAVSGLQGDWEWDTEGLTVSSGSSSVDDQQYSVTSLVLEPTTDQLRSAPADYPEEVVPFLDLPEDVPATLRDVFAEVTADSATGFDSAFAIQEYLRTEFDYSVSTPVEDGYDGDGFEAIAAFLEVRSGYCVHFASAMAILSRMAGIPARVSLGYLPGDRVGSDDSGRTSYRVGSDDLHAWPELYFAGVGWVPFEPTPGRGSTPAYATPGSTAPDGDDLPQNTPAPTSTSAPTSTPSAPATDPADDAGGAGSTASSTPAAAVGIVLLPVILLLLMVPAGVRAFRRRRRLAEASRDATVLPLWRELADTALDLGHPSTIGDSERDLSVRLVDVLDGDAAVHAAVRRLTASVESERYGSTAGRRTEREIGNAVADLRIVSEALSASAAPSRRALSVIAPASVLRPEPAPAARVAGPRPSDRG